MEKFSRLFIKMESKLPKLSSIKRPQIPLRSVLPMDRIRDRCPTASSAGHSSYNIANSTITSFQPLIRDPLNVCKPINLTMQKGKSF